MKFTFESIKGSDYLVYELQPEDQLDTMSAGMLTCNRIPGLAETVFTRTDDKLYIKYNITSRRTAASVFSGPMGKKRLLSILCSMVDGLLRAEDYMIERSSILLDREHIFIDSETGDAVLICLPLLGETGQPTPGAFFREVVFSWTNLEQEGDTGFMAALLDYFNGISVLPLAHFRELLEQLRGEQEEGPDGGDGESPDGPDNPPSGGDDAERPCLIRRRTGEVIELDKPCFRIGRERKAVDYAITGNPSISRTHIEVRFQNGEFRIWDEKSKYHTYVNGEQIGKKTWITIRSGDVLKLSNEEFDCKLDGTPLCEGV